MDTIKIVGNPLYQWELGRKVQIFPLPNMTVDEVHFSNHGDPEALVVKPKDENGMLVAEIPNILLQSGAALVVYSVNVAEGFTDNLRSCTFNVRKRAKPSDYVYTEVEILNYESLERRIRKLEESGVSDEQIANAVANYLAENPVESLTEEELAAAIEAYFAKNPIEGGTVTDEQIAQAVSDYMAEHPIEVPDSGGNVDYVGVEPAEDDIPKVFLTGTLPVTKSEVTMGFRYISKTEDVAGYVEIKCQGNTSMNFPKKNFTVKMYADEALSEKLKVDFKGWGKQNKHVYKANWIDITHARNVVSARLWADVVKSRANYAELPELLRTSPNQGAVDGFPIKVYSNGVYQGRYTLNIPKDAWMANMDDELDNHCILCGEGYTSGCFREVSTGQWTDEVHDSMPSTIANRWKEVISFVMNATDEDFRANLGNYFDVQSLIDYHLFGLASCGLDAYGKNQLYMTYDGQKWIASMYNMDATWGLWWSGSSFVATDYDRTEYQDFKDGEGNLLYIRLEELFFEELQARWAELRSGALSVDSIINRFERFTDIASAELVAEDYASTTADGKFTSIPSVSTNTIQQIRAFAVARHAWCDTYIARLVNVPCTGITLSTAQLSIVGEGSQTIIATVEPENTTDSIEWSSDNNGVATVYRGVVTSVANGSCVITAKCGNYSASCTVTVSGISEINYALDALSGVTWHDGYTYNKNTGVMEDKAGQHSTDKFTMQNCVHNLVPASGCTWPTIHMWDENGNYAGKAYGSGNAFGQFTPNPEYTYAIDVYNGSEGADVTGTTLLPVDNSGKVVETMHFEFAKLSWTRTGSGFYEADASSVLSEHGVAWSELNSGIAKSNYVVIPNGMNASNLTGDPVCRFTYHNSVPLLIVFAKQTITTIDAFNAWVAEENPVLTIN